jgi:hypothetical protein
VRPVSIRHGFVEFVFAVDHVASLRRWSPPALDATHRPRQPAWSSDLCLEQRGEGRFHGATDGVRSCLAE